MDLGEKNCGIKFLNFGFWIFFEIFEKNFGKILLFGNFFILYPTGGKFAPPQSPVGLGLISLKAHLYR